MPIIYPGQSNAVPDIGTVAPSNSAWAWEVYDTVNHVSIDHATALGTTGANGWTVSAGTSGVNDLVTPPVGFPADTNTDQYEFRINSIVTGG